MLYIEKEGLPNDINSKIIELSKSEKWKSISEDDTTAIRNAFDNDFPKNEAKEILLHEQHGICAYCMRRIRMDNHSRVEHLVPLSKNKDMAIDYNNMLGVCDGGEKVTGNQGHILCCDAHKKETEIMISPLNKVQMNKIAYDSEGKIYTKPKDEDMERDINTRTIFPMHGSSSNICPNNWPGRNITIPPLMARRPALLHGGSAFIQARFRRLKARAE